MHNGKSRNFAYINRELAWLDFNARILKLAQREATNPLLERLRFICITAANLDEFFMVRVGGLQLLKKSGKRQTDPADMTPAQQLEAIAYKAHAFIKDQYVVANEIRGQLEQNGLRRLYSTELTGRYAAKIRKLCQKKLVSILTPMLLENEGTAPLLQGLRLYLLIRFVTKGQERFAAMPLSPGADRHYFIPQGKIINYVLLEDAVAANLDLWFGNAEIKEAVVFRITRNADITVREDEGEPFMRGMERVLQERKESHVVRLEIPECATTQSVKFLKKFLGLTRNDIYTIPNHGPIQLGDYFTLCDLKNFDNLRFNPWQPYHTAEFNGEASIFTQIAAKDRLLFHPYESFAPIVNFLEEAANDPDVLAIKQILYRTSLQSPIVAALERAALNGKYVTAVVELKARFDEERNINWARRLERAGVQVIYGVQNYKVHAKCCLVVKRENDILRRYTHWSTGNYNETTALIYSDTGLFSARDDLGADASTLFNALCGLDTAHHFNKISIAPLGLRKQLEMLLDNEIRSAKTGHKAFLMAKMNACTDESMIAKLYEASQAGVKIKLNVRGACCLIPGIPGLSENIQVLSIVGRYLEHARILYFYNNGNPLMFITSADCMTRNLENRIETLVPVEDKDAIKKLKVILDTYWRDNENAWELNRHGIFEPKKPLPGAEIINSQKIFESMALYKSRQARANQGFKPLKAREQH